MKLLLENFKKFLNEETEPAVSEGEGYEVKVLDRYGNPAKKLHTWKFTLEDRDGNESWPMTITHEGWALARADYKRILRTQHDVYAGDEKIKSTKLN